MNRRQISLYVLLISAVTTQAQLAVIVSPPKVNGQKAVVLLTMENHIGENVESARAVCFLLDNQGEMAGQSTKWVIGQNKTSLAIGATNTFNFVITSNQPFTTTNLTAKVSFSRVVLAGGQVADVNMIVNMTPPSNYRANTR